jgi:urease accessory protein
MGVNIGMGTDTNTTTTDGEEAGEAVEFGTDADLAAFRLADSFLPVGATSLSYALEQFVQAGDVQTAAELRELLETYLRRQVGGTDLVALRHAHAAARDGDVDRVCTVDERLSAATLPAEFRRGSARTGARLLSLHKELIDDDVLVTYAARAEDDGPPANYAVVLGVTTAVMGVGLRRACLLSCHGFTTGMAGAAQRLASLGHTEVQRVLDGLRPTMQEAVERSAGRPITEMESFTPLVEVRSCEHERADRRLFMN